MNHAERAKELFKEGYSCSQAVLLAFGDETGMDAKTALKAASSFGGGIGRLREVCGTVSGAMIALGLIAGYSDPSDEEGKKAQYRMIQEFAARFRERNGSIICRELLRGTGATVGGAPEKRTEEFYKKRPCADLAWEAAEILDELLAESRSAGETEEKKA